MINNAVYMQYIMLENKTFMYLNVFSKFQVGQETFECITAFNG